MTRPLVPRPPPAWPLCRRRTPGSAHAPGRSTPAPPSRSPRPRPRAASTSWSPGSGCTDSCTDSCTGSRVDSSYPEQLPEPIDGQLRICENAGLVGQPEGVSQVRQRPPGLQTTDHGEAGLVAVQPGQEGDAGLVVVRRRREDLPRQRNGRLEDLLVRREVTPVQGLQSGCGCRCDRREDPEQCVAVAVRVAADQLGVIEVVAGVQPDALGQTVA